MVILLTDPTIRGCVRVMDCWGRGWVRDRGLVRGRDLVRGKDMVWSRAWACHKVFWSFRNNFKINICVAHI